MRTLCRGRLAGDPKLTQQSASLNGTHLRFSPCSVGVANMATRRPENRVARSMGKVSISEFRRGRQFGDPPPPQLSGTFRGGRFRFLSSVGVGNLPTRCPAAPRNRAVMYNGGRLPYATALPPTGRQIGDPYRGAAIKCSGSAADGSTGGGMAMIHHRGSGSNPPATSNDYFQHTAKHFDIRHRCG